MNDSMVSSLDAVKLIKRIINMACFYGGWFYCMREATGPNPFLGPLLILFLLVYHLATTNTFRVDLKLIVIMSLVGTVVDSIYIWSGLMTFKGGYVCCPYIAPMWITALWALYATSINHSLEWLKLHYYLIAAPLGAIGAISSYIVGIRLGAAEIHMQELVVLGVIGLIWAVNVPLSLKLSHWLQKEEY